MVVLTDEGWWCFALARVVLTGPQWKWGRWKHNNGTDLVISGSGMPRFASTRWTKTL
ncbi:M23 family peptidase [Sesbania bispinosa]|nr:M23 family peptidase [Sesbania bispinosa]